MANQVFISYRRADSIKDARALFERLSREFERDKVFIDLDGIGPGEDFVAHLQQQLEGCAALVVVIGPGWASERRLHNEYDFVRLEVASGLERGIKVFPVLINGATMPAKEDLPEGLHSLLTRQAVVLDDRKFDADIDKLAQAIRKVIDRPPDTDATKSMNGEGRLDLKSAKSRGRVQEVETKKASGDAWTKRTLTWLTSRPGLTVIGSNVLALLLIAGGTYVFALLAGLVGAVVLVVLYYRSSVWSFERDLALLCVGIAIISSGNPLNIVLWPFAAIVGGVILRFAGRNSG
jgi:TIR domain